MKQYQKKNYNKLSKYFRCLAVLGFFSICFTSCLDNEPAPIQIDHFIDNRLKPYFDKFKEEASARGFEFDFKELKVDGYIQGLSQSSVAGQCQTYETGNSAVIVQPIYWDNITELEKEFLIFHELGHCILDRAHLEDANPDGTCKSIMNSGGLFCDINYNIRTRDEYIDELFSN